MKQPRLPGTEKFKFASSDKPVVYITNPKQRPHSLAQACDLGSPASHVFHSRKASCSSQSELSPSSSISSITVLNRNDSKRRAVLPITCKKTSRMLTNTNLELNVDQADIVSEDSEEKLSRLHLESNRVPSCPNLETSSRTLNSSKTSLDTYFRKMSLQNSVIRELPPNFDWKNIRASISRLSTSCSSSCSSEENIWVLRKNS